MKFKRLQRLKRILAFTLYLLALQGVISGQTPKQPLTDEQKIAELALLWKEADYNFVFFDKAPNLNWNDTFKDFIPQVVAARSEIEYIRVLQRFMALLHEGHANAVPSQEIRRRYGGIPPVELDVIENRPVVVNVAKSLAKELPVGSVILTVDGVPVDTYLDEKALPFISASTELNHRLKAIQGRGEPAVGLLVREVGTKIKITYETPDGKMRSSTLECLVPDAKSDWAKPPERDWKIFTMRWLEGGIAFIELNGFDKKEVADEFEANLPELAKAKAVIFDIRKNKGGNSAWGDAIGSRFIKAPLTVSKWLARENVSAYRALGRYRNYPQYKEFSDGKAFQEIGTNIIEPKAPFLDVPVIVLIGNETYSAGEDFAALMNQIPRVKLIGSATAGSTGQPLILKLPYSGAFAGITSKKDVLPDGTDIVGNGIKPNIEIRQTIQAFRAGRDIVLEAAIKELQPR